jgi:hypothetical protein
MLERRRRMETECMVDMYTTWENEIRAKTRVGFQGRSFNLYFIFQPERGYGPDVIANTPCVRSDTLPVTLVNPAADPLLSLHRFPDITIYCRSTGLGLKQGLSWVQSRVPQGQPAPVRQNRTRHGSGMKPVRVNRRLLNHPRVLQPVRFTCGNRAQNQCILCG